MTDPLNKPTVEPPKVWVIAACFNEEAAIVRFIERVVALNCVSRLVLVDDGSSDNTVNQIQLWQEKSEQPEAFGKITLIELTRNFGKEAAMLAGLDYAQDNCEAVVIIDSDLQHPPELIFDMVEEWQKGAEIVTAVRDDRDKESPFKVATASWFYKVFNRLVDSIQLIEGAGDYRLLSAPVIKALIQMREFSRFSKGLVPWTGYKSVQLSYMRESRMGGHTSWSPLKLWSYALDGIFSFSDIPLKVWSLLGITVSMCSLFYAGLIIIRTLSDGPDQGAPGYASLIVAILFLGGVQLIGIGVLGDYIGRIYLDAKARPHYFIRSIHVQE
ncbi:glycosyltransferase family 2 protein [Prochlorococcus sp. MIT 1300]|uniref:glycosyltransferase family 2 protein n=1 Tax=Prochlorococcus sp. MIT 1300 TaxID=3096218 RepID=UPI002A751E6A|nr:glycosyltransferase family 2 protein [Prochlorococcus sp. MIT 1300]